MAKDETFAFGPGEGPIGVRGELMWIVWRIAGPDRRPYCYAATEGIVGRLTALLQDDAMRRRGRYRARCIDGKETLTGEDLP